MLPSLAFAFDRYFRVALDGAEHLREVFVTGA